MINLLPPKEKEILLSEINKKLIVVLGIAVLVFLIFLSLVFFFLRYYFLQELFFQKEELSAAEKKYENSDIVRLGQVIGEYNADLAEINDFYKNKIYFSNLLKEISEIQEPEGLRLTRIISEKGSKTSVFGESKNRDALLAFKENLEKSEKIIEVEFSPNSWIKAKDVEFQFVFTVKN